MNLKRLLFGFAPTLVLAGQGLLAQQSDAGDKQLTELRAKAEQGDGQAQLELGEAFRLGKLGLTTNFVEGVKWYRKAAGQNLALAQYNLGVACFNGQGMPKDEAEAVKWFCKAAEQNETRAQCYLGYCYSHGAGVAEDDVEGMKWYRKAAEQNDPAAQNNLGCCYRDGQGVAKDDVEAYKWMRLAAAQGEGRGSKAMSILEGSMSQEQIAEGKRRANDWLEQRKKSSSASQ